MSENWKLITTQGKKKKSSAKKKRPPIPHITSGDQPERTFQLPPNLLGDYFDMSKVDNKVQNKKPKTKTTNKMRPVQAVVPVERNDPISVPHQGPQKKSIAAPLWKDVMNPKTSKSPDMNDDYSLPNLFSNRHMKKGISAESRKTPTRHRVKEVKGGKVHRNPSVQTSKSTPLRETSDHVTPKLGKKSRTSYPPPRKQIAQKDKTNPLDKEIVPMPDSYIKHSAKQAAKNRIIQRPPPTWDGIRASLKQNYSKTTIYMGRNSRKSQTERNTISIEGSTRIKRKNESKVQG
eukprot:954338_1